MNFVLNPAMKIVNSISVYFTQMSSEWYLLQKFLLSQNYEFVDNLGARALSLSSVCLLVIMS